MAKLRSVLVSIGVLVVLLAGSYFVSIYGRPPMPVAFGTVLWVHECGFTASGVTRHPAGPQATAYEVTARVLCPYGDRYAWNSRSAYVIDSGGRAYYANAGPPDHKVLGASDTEHLRFDLPNAIEQPALVFDETLRFPLPRHRFNLRFD